MKTITTNNRNSFVLYQDNAEILESLTDEQRGKLFLAIFDYQKDFKLPEDPFIRLALSSFIAQFKRDSQKWEKTCEEKTISGKMGNLKRWHPELYKKVIDGKVSLSDAMLSLQTQELSQPNRTRSHPIGKVANIAVNDSVSVNVNDNSYSNPNTINNKTPTPKNGVEKIGNFGGGVGVKNLRVIDIVGQINSITIQEINKIAPNWDIEHLAKVYVDGINSGKREAPNSISKAFPKWCEKYTKGQKPN